MKYSPSDDLGVFDPMFSGGLGDIFHGTLIYETLFAYDNTGLPQPQMVDTWITSPDGLVWTFTLWDGLTFHDGTPVTSEEVVLSLERWGTKRGTGVAVFNDTESLVAMDSKTFRFTLTTPLGVLLSGLSQPTGVGTIIMTKTDALVPVTEPAEAKVGSGPFRFINWSGLASPLRALLRLHSPQRAGQRLCRGKIVNIDELEWPIIPDVFTRTAALETGEIDYMEGPTLDDFPRLSANPDIETPFQSLDNWPVLMFNHRYPPFDDLNARRAVMLATGQFDFLSTAVPEEFVRECIAIFGCGNIWESSEGPRDEIINGDLALAQTLWDQAYNGETIRLLNDTNWELIVNSTLVLVDTLEKLGVPRDNIDIRDGDDNVTIGRIFDDSPDVWNMYAFFSLSSYRNPLAHFILRAPWNGGYDDPRIEEAQSQFLRGTSVASQKEAVDEMQRVVYETLAARPLGQTRSYTAYRSWVKDVIIPNDRNHPIFWGLWLDR